MPEFLFIARCLSVSLAVFVLLYVALSLLVPRCWNLLSRWSHSLSARHTAAFLFFLRMLPLLASITFTLAVTVPSFLLLEPRATNEEVGAAPMLLGACCLSLVAFGIWRAILAQRKATQVLHEWLHGASQIESDIRIPVYQVGASAPALTVAGVCTPRVLVSKSASAMLSEREMQTALRHELAHVANRDNFKKLLFRVTTFPGMRGIETAWSDAAEMAADDAAVSSLDDALDLASALIKLSRLVLQQPGVPLPSSLLPGSVASLNARVQRLFAWSSHPPSADHASRILVPTLLATIVGLAASYGSVLSRMHAATEWLVR
jgi:Zn-dependent protease with chaperone function